MNVPTYATERGRPLCARTCWQVYLETIVNTRRPSPIDDQWLIFTKTGPPKEVMVGALQKERSASGKHEATH